MKISHLDAQWLEQKEGKLLKESLLPLQSYQQLVPQKKKKKIINNFDFNVARTFSSTSWFPNANINSNVVLTSYFHYHYSKYEVSETSSMDFAQKNPI